MFSPRVRQWAFDALVALGILGLATLGIFMRITPRPTMIVGALMAAAILLRRKTPVLTMGIVGVLALSQVIIWPPGSDPLPYDLAVLVAMFSAVKYSKHIFAGYLAGLTVAIGIVIEVVRHWSAANWWAMALFYTGVCGGVWLMAYTMRTRRLYVQTLEERAASLEREREHLARIAVADERASIARELHDVVAHSLAVMIVQADGGRYAFDPDPARARQALNTVADTGREALEDMRRLVGVLRGSAQDAEERRRDTLPELIQRARAAGLSVSADHDEVSLSPALELTVFRLVQESLTNVMRHAGPAATVSLTLRRKDDRVELEVVDDGVGEAKPGAGHGLTGMRERVAVHSGQFEAGPLVTGGWRVFASLPCEAA